MKSYIRNIFRIKYLRDTVGSIMPMTAIMLPLILGMAGVGTDVSLWIMNKRQLQSAADAAAMAAAWEIANNYDEIDIDDVDFEQEVDEAFVSYHEYAALKEAQKNGFDPDKGVLEVDYVINESGQKSVTVSISEEQDLFFAPFVFSGDVMTSAAAATAVISTGGNFCLLALDDTADGAITAVGSVEIEAEGCGIAVNSNSDSALDLTGNVSVDIADLHIVGDYETTGSVDLDADTIETNASRIPDPYSDLEVPDFSGCDENNFRSSRDVVLEPGVYCGGIRLTGNATVEMEPGVYIMDCGDFTVSGGGEIIGENVSIIITCSDEDDYGNINISGNKEVLLTAPEEGDDMEGVVLYKDRNAPEGNQCNKIIGTSAVQFDGAAYLPSDCLQIGGNGDAVSDASDPCSRVIAKTIQLNGNPLIANGCDGSAAKDIGSVGIRLTM